MLNAGKIQLGWEATDSTTEAEYSLYRSYTANGKKERLLTTKATQHEMPFDASHAEQYFCVTASLNGAAESECSNVARIQRPETTPPK